MHIKVGVRNTGNMLTGKRSRSSFDLDAISIYSEITEISEEEEALSRPLKMRRDRDRSDASSASTVSTSCNDMAMVSFRRGHITRHLLRRSNLVVPCTSEPPLLSCFLSKAKRDYYDDLIARYPKWRDVIEMTNNSFGAYGERVAKQYLGLQDRMASSQHDASYNGVKIEIKSSRYWKSRNAVESGFFRWQHIIPTHDWDILLCLSLENHGIKILAMTKAQFLRAPIKMMSSHADGAREFVLDVTVEEAFSCDYPFECDIISTEEELREFLSKHFT